MSKLSPAQRLLQQNAAFKMNNSAASLFLQCQDDEAFAMYRQSLTLLIEATPTDIAPQEENGQHKANQGHAYSHSAIQHFEQPIVIPIQEEQFQGNLTNWSEESEAVAFAALAVMYNIFLVLRRSTNDHDTIHFLELVYTLSERDFKDADLHPRFRMALKFRLAEVAHEFGAIDESWTLFVEAIEIAEANLPHDIMFATVCTRMGRLLIGEGYYQQAQAVYAKASRIYELPVSQKNSILEQEHIDEEEIESMPFGTTTAAAA